ncbi:MAG TPA: biotin--[acetyl-CoA-carboxylase] ligase [Casimicrobiaceae bacterium]|nr:biotin--[acetyl-CoA-carboxylase] ligase [Casimicrobiaceae bacterium]
MLTPLGFRLLRRLADGQIHSGEALASAVGMSRARVSQLLKEADGAGLKLERIRGRGYRLHDPAPFLDRDLIAAALGTPARSLRIDLVDTVDSTNSELLRRAAREDVHRSLLIAEWQTAGRGRRGRAWTAVAGGSVTLSLGWRFEQGAGFLAGLSLAVGVALARALERIGIVGVELKWPNDLVHRYHKFGGILIELSGDALGPSLAVIGAGLNVRLPPAARRGIAQPVTDLATIARGPAIDRNRLVGELVGALIAMLEEYATEGFAPFIGEWQRRNAFRGKSARIVLPDGSVASGQVVGVDASGALVLDRGGRRLRFVSGELSLRRP